MSFPWAYIDKNSALSASGPTGSLQSKTQLNVSYCLKPISVNRHYGANWHSQRKPNKC